jgi:hypothetical protein
VNLFLRLLWIMLTARWRGSGSALGPCRTRLVPVVVAETSPLADTVSTFRDRDACLELG